MRRIRLYIEHTADNRWVVRPDPGIIPQLPKKHPPIKPNRTRTHRRR